MIRIYSAEKYLLLDYEPYEGVEWIIDKFKNKESINIRKIFYLKYEDMYLYLENFDINFEEMETDSYITFVIANITNDGRYYKLNKEIFDIEFDFYLQSDMNFDKKYFMIDNNVSVFKRLSEYIEEEFYIGDNDECMISIKLFDDLIKTFPNKYEMNLYRDARITAMLRKEFDKIEDIKEKYEKYMNKKATYVGDDIVDIFKHAELEKYKLILDKLTKMLENQDVYNETQWQKEILQIIQLIYPKYIAVIREVIIKDVYTNKDKKLDYLLIDSNGNTDIIEIKKPSNDSIITTNTYRDNYIPLRELSGTVMQIEKYIYYLNKWGKQGEEILTQKFKNQLPTNFEIKIINPKAIIIMGRENTLNRNQKNDFEIIKRKYSNVYDIITYDDLLRRIELLILKFS